MSESAFPDCEFPDCQLITVEWTTNATLVTFALPPGLRVGVGTMTVICPDRLKRLHEELEGCVPYNGQAGNRLW